MSRKPLPKRVKDLPPIDLESDNSVENEEKSITAILQTIVEQKGVNRSNAVLPTGLMPKENAELSELTPISEETLGKKDPENGGEDTLPCTATIATPKTKDCRERQEKVILSVDYKKHLKENNRNLANLSIKDRQKSSSESCTSTALETNNSVHDEKPRHRVVQINGKDYNVVRKLGHGGSSVVYLAHMVGSSLECALKVIRLNGDANALSDNIHEIELLKRLQGKSIVTLFDHYYSQHDSILYIVMERGERDLSAILKEFPKSLPVYTIMDFWHQMLKCVQYIHACNVIHCDIKPGNFLIVNGRLKLIDFGIASNISSDSTSIIKHTQAGTYNYISPEALIDISTDEDTQSVGVPKIKISPKTDVWSLGCIFFQFIYKVTPFGNIKNMHSKIIAICNPDTVIDYPPLPSIYPAMFLEIAQQCLRHNPRERISIKDLLGYPFEMFIPPQ
ncbi:dual specificity protein kinase TTK [Phlebotomus argentipes]|uniref:dual specificity protein kinase TTK n=1 Tax=Phlebotomus argentipes TaxID=94469 RepID=UPI0028936877|nr:dual specificity protein kinase TTK [Phlebotomus argentipes]